MANLRMAQVFAYLMMFVVFVVAWEVIFFLLETIVNFLVITVLGIPTSGLDLPTPLELMSEAVTRFPDLYAIGTYLFWGFVEELAFIAYVVTGAVAALFSNALFKTTSTYFLGVSDSAGGKSKPPRTM